jgi:hypothetical protein
MKGIVFTKYLASEGIIGTYNFSKRLSLLQNLSKNLVVSINNLLLVYVAHLFAVLKNSYPVFIEYYKDLLGMILSIEYYIDIEVIKNYPDKDLPIFIIPKK